MSNTDTSTTVAAWTTTWQRLMLAAGLLALLLSGGGTNILASAEGNIGKWCGMVGCLFFPVRRVSESLAKDSQGDAGVDRRKGLGDEDVAGFFFFG